MKIDTLYRIYERIDKLLCVGIELKADTPSIPLTSDAEKAVVCRANAIELREETRSIPLVSEAGKVVVRGANEADLIIFKEMKVIWEWGGYERTAGESNGREIMNAVVRSSITGKPYPATAESVSKANEFFTTAMLNGLRGYCAKRVKSLRTELISLMEKTTVELNALNSCDDNFKQQIFLTFFERLENHIQINRTDFNTLFRGFNL